MLEIIEIAIEIVDFLVLEEHTFKEKKRKILYNLSSQNEKKLVVLIEAILVINCFQVNKILI